MGLGLEVVGSGRTKTKQKPVPEQGDGLGGLQNCCCGLDAILQATERLHMLQKFIIPRRHTQSHRAPCQWA